MIRISIVSLFVFFNAALANAQGTYDWEVMGGASSQFSSYRQGGSSDQTFGMSGIASVFLTERVALTTALSVAAFSNSGLSTPLTTVLMGPTYNFSDKIQESFYVSALGGLTFYSRKSGASISYFRYSVSAGKRFALIDRVSWSPEISFSGNPETTRVNSSTSIGITLFQFSILF